MNHIEVARKGEELAREFLEHAGYEILQANYRYGHGEIDLIAKDGEYFVFAEVKTRLGDSYGHPLLSITPAKQKQIAAVARAYFFEKKLQDVPCRFDVLTVEYRAGVPVVEHYYNAFTLTAFYP